MKSVFIFLFVGLMAGNAFGASVVGCVNFDSSITCTRTSVPDSAQTEFTVTCNGVTVKGVGLAGPRPDNFNTTSDTITADVAVGSAHDVCWCKILSPVVSQWAPSYYYGKTPYEANGSCPHICSLALISPSSDANLQVLHDLLLSGPFTE